MRMTDATELAETHIATICAGFRAALLSLSLFFGHLRRPFEFCRRCSLSDEHAVGRKPFRLVPSHGFPLMTSSRRQDGVADLLCLQCVAESWGSGFAVSQAF